MRVDIRDLSKTYRGGVTALSGVSLSLDRGLYGLLGPNGAGKSTLMKILCTLLEPSGGTILVDGVDLAEDRGRVRDHLGYLGQEWSAPPKSRCAEVLDLVLRLRGVSEPARRRSEVERLLEVVGLAPFAKRHVKKLSGGMRRRLGVAQALAGDPELLVMDEPTVGLDPDERVEFRNLLGHLGRERTILLSTHIVADVGNTCSRMAVIARGKVLFEGPPDELVQRATGRVFEVALGPGDAELSLPGAITVSSRPEVDGTRVRIVGTPPHGFRSAPVEPALEDAYLLLVQEAGEFA